MNIEGPQDDDPLLALFQRLRETLAPLGIQVDPIVLHLWRDSQARGTGLFTRSGQFSPEVTARLLELARELAAETGDAPRTAGLRGAATVVIRDGRSAQRIR